MASAKALLLTFALAGFYLAAAASEFALAEDKVRFSVAAVTGSYMDEFVAIEKGYHRDEGLSVEMIRAGGGIATQALIARRSPFQHLRRLGIQRDVARRRNQSDLHQHRSSRLSIMVGPTRDQDSEGSDRQEGRRHQPR